MGLDRAVRDDRTDLWLGQSSPTGEPYNLSPWPDDLRLECHQLADESERFCIALKEKYKELVSLKEEVKKQGKEYLIF